MGSLLSLDLGWESSCCSKIYIFGQQEHRSHGPWPSPTSDRENIAEAPLLIIMRGSAWIGIPKAMVGVEHELLRMGSSGVTVHHVSWKARLKRTCRVQAWISTSKLDVERG